MIFWLAISSTHFAFSASTRLSHIVETWARSLAITKGVNANLQKMVQANFFSTTGLQQRRVEVAKDAAGIVLTELRKQKQWQSLYRLANQA